MLTVLSFLVAGVSCALLTRWAWSESRAQGVAFFILSAWSLFMAGYSTGGVS